jgi:hypothetical protein
MSDPNETANLVGQLARGYREHLAEEAGPEIIAVPGRVLGGDIEGQADALADDAARLAELLTAFAREPGQRSMDPIAVFRGLSRAAESMAAARPPSCAARNGSTSRTMRSRRPSPLGTALWRA